MPAPAPARAGSAPFPLPTARLHSAALALAPCRQNGAPLSQQGVHKIFSTTAYRFTGKKCNPHLVRDSIVTYLR